VIKWGKKKRIEKFVDKFVCLYIENRKAALAFAFYSVSPAKKMLTSMINGGA
jgi:hypothetical protein